MAQRNMEMNKSKRILESNQAYCNAKEYLIGSHILVNAKDVHILPAIMCASFSCELFMKAILIYSGSNKVSQYGHHLKQLFNDLPVDARKKVTQNVVALNWTQFLEQADSIFVEQRYCHEHIDTRIRQITISDYWQAADQLRQYYETYCLNDQELQIIMEGN